jgi:predicted MPP superfamily phosphohydrolase
LAYRLHLFPALTLLVISLAIQFQLSRWILRSPKWCSRSRRAIVAIVNLVLAGLCGAGYLLGFNRVSRHVPMWWATWIEAGALFLSMTFIALFAGAVVWRAGAKFRPGRRLFFRAAGGAIMAAPYVMTAFGIAGRNRLVLNEVDIAVPNLPKDLQGLRITQISDIHLSPFLSEKEFARAIDMANESKPHLMLVTGDLISRPGDPLDACLRQLARLRADAGVLGCLGNHEVYCDNQHYITEQGLRIGIDFLRGRSRMLRFGNTDINFAGVDYQKFGEPYLIGAESMVAPGAINVMLSHNPDVFEVAASQGYDVTIAGHTHGGQVNVEILRQHLNVARYFTPYVRGVYRRDKAVIYVSSGIGTIGVPVRIGAPAEVAVLRLCAS